MTGPEHYLAAERLLEEANENPSAPLDRTEWRLGQAQVHAMLALTAATALDTEHREWFEVAGTRLSG